MSIQRLGTGKYKVRWNEGGRKRARTFDRRRDGEKFEAEVRRRKAMGGIVAIPERVTLGQLHDRWLGHLEEKGRERNTLSSMMNRAIVSGYVEPNPATTSSVPR